MNVAVLCRRLSDNTFVRSYLLLQTLSNAHVDVFGVVDKRGIHPFFEQDRFDFHTIPTSTYGNWDGESVNFDRAEHLGRQGIDAFRLWRKLLGQRVDPDVVYVASGWKGSVGAGLLARYVSHRDVPLVVDVYDHTDWIDQVPFVNPLDYADEVIASNRPLAERLGGRTIHTPVDVARFEATRYDRSGTREELGFDDTHTVVGFIGTPRKEKGIDALVEAIDESDEHIRGLIVGAGDDAYANRLRWRSSEKVTFVPPVPHSEVPRYYAALDAMVLAQQRTSYCEYQIPAKLFEAMSMATPVIATRIGDIPYVLGDAGMLIENPTSDAIGEAIEEIASVDADEMGRRGRARVCEQFSEEVLGTKLELLLADFIEDVDSCA